MNALHRPNSSPDLFFLFLFSDFYSFASLPFFNLSSHYNNIVNLQTDCNSGVIDAVLHMGDHAYNMGMAADRRGDA